MGQTTGGPEWFVPTSGRFLGGIGITVAVLAMVLPALDGLGGTEVAVASGGAFFAVLIWATMLRPRVGLTAEDLVLRNPVSTTTLPLASIEQVSLRQVLAVRAGERRFVSPSLGRSRRSMRKVERRGSDPQSSYADFVEDRIHQSMDDARSRAGVAVLSDEQLALAEGVRRRWAWPEIVALVVTSVAFVLTALVG